MKGSGINDDLFIAENFDIRIIKISSGEEINGLSNCKSLDSSDERNVIESNTDILMRLDHTDAKSNYQDDIQTIDNSSRKALNKSPVKFEKKRRKAGYRNIDGEKRKVYKVTNNGQFQCAECEEEFKSQHAARCHYSREHTDTLHNCNQCPSLSISMDNDVSTLKSLNKSKKKETIKEGYRFLDGEMRKVYKKTENGQFQCAECEKQYNTSGVVRKHYTREHTNVVYNCNHCPYVSKIKSDLVDHLKHRHIGIEELKTNFLDSQTNLQLDENSSQNKNEYNININIRKMKKRFIITENGQFQCTECEKQYDMVAALRIHYSREHIDIFYNCNQCPYITTEKSRLKGHINLVHSEKDLKCTHCKKRLKNKYFYELHVKKPHINNCDKCEKAFIHSSQLKKHMRNSHEDMKADGPQMFVKKQTGKYACIKCNQQFNQGSAVNRHYRKAHMNTVYYCDLCVYSTKDKYSLNTHMKLKHSGNGWICQDCQKAFETKLALEAHSIKAHYYHCGQCDRAFVNNIQLQLHINIDHEGKELNHYCKICNKIFMHLDKHIEDVHRYKTTHCQKCRVELKSKSLLENHKCNVDVRYY